MRKLYIYVQGSHNYEEFTFSLGRTAEDAKANRIVGILWQYPDAMLEKLEEVRFEHDQLIVISQFSASQVLVQSGIFQRNLEDDMYAPHQVGRAVGAALGWHHANKVWEQLYRHWLMPPNQFKQADHERSDNKPLDR